MLSLESSLYNHELIVLRVIGEWWELDLTGSQKKDCVLALTEVISHLDMAVEVTYLGPEEAATFEDLLKAGGRISIAAFERKHGTVRLMGPGRLEREEPWLDPVSPAEGLWYRGFVFRSFDETERRRARQEQYNQEHGITPTTIKKKITSLHDSIWEADYVTAPRGDEEAEPGLPRHEIPALIG